jgi:Cytochrome P460
MDSMSNASKPILLLAVALLGTWLPEAANMRSSAGAEYTGDGQLKFPEHYREWIFLSSDFHPASKPADMQKGGHDKFLNVFVNPEAYKAFLKAGTWPDKTMLVVETRPAESLSMNNQTGDVQGLVEGVAIHVKDEARFPGKWAFFGFHGEKTATMIPVTAGCYSCHATQGAVDTTFLQYYPSLLAIAKGKDTLSAAYRQVTESAAPRTK